MGQLLEEHLVLVIDQGNFPIVSPLVLKELLYLPAEFLVEATVLVESNQGAHERIQLIALFKFFVKVLKFLNHNEILLKNIGE